MANENYNVCLNLLKERYEDKQLMIYSHMSKLLKHENLADVKHISGLRKLFDTIDLQVWSLKNLGYEPDRCRPLLIPIITSNIPDDLNLIISRKFDSADSWDKEIVFNVLKSEITARNKVKMCKMNILESLLRGLLCSAIRKNCQFCVYFTKKILCEQVNVVLCV